MKEIVMGCIPSTMDGSEKIYGVDIDFVIPEEYTYEDNLPSVLDQGSEQICVPFLLI